MLASSPKPRLLLAMLAIGSLAGMAALDFVTGQELVFSCAYLIPVSLSAWWFRRRWMVAMSVASGVTALAVDHFDGFSYSHPGIEYWNAFTCLAISLVTGWVLCRLKSTLAERAQANAELREALRKLEVSTAEIRKLQEGLQTVCAWTHRIQVGDEWMSTDQFLSTKLGLKLSHGISPEAYEQALREIPAAA